MTYIHNGYIHMCNIESWWGPAVGHRELSSALSHGLEVWGFLFSGGSRRKIQEGGDICIYIADSLC